MATESGAAPTTSQNVDPALQKDNIASRTPIERPKSARDLLMEDIDSKIEAARATDDEYFLSSGDPRAAMMAAEMRKEARGEAITADKPRDEQGRFTAEAGEDGDPHSEGNADVEREAPRARAADPLEEYVVREAGKPPMFKAMVDGKVRLIPLEQARSQLQKHVAAEQRMEQATARSKELDARERALQAREAARVAPPAPAKPAYDDAALDKDAMELVRSLVSEPEATAASKMAGVLKKIRAATPQIDLNALSKQAASVAKQEIAADDHNRALVDGLNKFNTDYSDIATDPDLYALADRKTDAIAKEHPEWKPEQVMLEAGKQTRAWVNKLAGKPADFKPGPKVDNLDSRRQQAKQKLTPMPQARSVRPAPTTDANADDSPTDYLAGLRKARGQPS
jgi:hypothetical protein